MMMKKPQQETGPQATVPVVAATSSLEAQREEGCSRRQGQATQQGVHREALQWELAKQREKVTVSLVLPMPTAPSKLRPAPPFGQNTASSCQETLKDSSGVEVGGCSFHTENCRGRRRDGAEEERPRASPRILSRAVF